MQKLLIRKDQHLELFEKHSLYRVFGNILSHEVAALDTDSCNHDIDVNYEIDPGDSFDLTSSIQRLREMNAAT